MKALIFLLLVLLLTVCVVVGTNDLVVAKKQNMFTIESKK